MDKNETDTELAKGTMPEEIKSKENPSDIINTLQAVHQCQTRLIILADHKANALLGVLTVVFTILFANVQRLAVFPLVGKAAFFCFLLMEVMGMAFALLVIFPKNIAIKGPELPEQMSNPFFFGIYTQFGEKEYVNCMMNKLTNGAAARRLLLTDYYQVGVILKQKYSQLRRAYLLAVGGFAFLILALVSSILNTIISCG